MMAQETAYEAGNWPVFIYAGQQALGLMRTLHQEFGWTENRLEEFLSERRLIKSLFEPGYREKMIAAQDAAGAHY